MSYETDFTEQPVVTIGNSTNGEKVLIIHSHINQKGKMILKKDEALLLIVELYKFVKE
jgi:hypothetical protein